MNAAVLMFSACLLGAEPAPIVVPAAPAPVVASSTGNCGAIEGGCGGISTSCHKIGLLDKLKAKLCTPTCATPALPAFPVAKCEPCHKITITKIPKFEPAPVACNTCGSGLCGGPKINWYPGMHLAKLKAKICGTSTCDAAPGCQGGCGSASTGGCGSVVIPPTTLPPETMVPVNPKVTPVDPKAIPKEMPKVEPKGEPKKVVPVEPKKVSTPNLSPVIKPVVAPSLNNTPRILELN